MRAVRLLHEGTAQIPYLIPHRRATITSWRSFLQLLADPDRMCSGLHRHTYWRQIREPLLNRLRRGSKTASTDYFAVFVEGAGVGCKSQGNARSQSRAGAEVSVGRILNPQPQPTIPDALPDLRVFRQSLRSCTSL
jgi:hypothetical protein